MGFTPNSSPKGGPTFNNSPQTTADLNEERRFTEERGNGMVGTNSDRSDVSGAALYEGLTFYETDTKRTYQVQAGAWELLSSPWTAYTPVWTAAGGTTAMGASVLSGAYRRGRAGVDFRIYFKLGTGSSQGTGDWRFTLPVAAASGLTRTPIPANIENSGVGFYTGSGFIEPSATVVGRIAMNSGAGHVAGGTGGPTWQPNSVIVLAGTYQV